MAEPGSITAAVRVMVVDDERPFHAAAHDLIDATPGFEWVGGASSGEEAIEQVEHVRPDLILMDVRMPGIGGLEAAREMTLRGVSALVVLVTADDPQPHIGHSTAPEILPKHKLSRAALRRLWESSQ